MSQTPDILYGLKNRTQDELCDIYWNLIDGIWDRRIGRKPNGFEWIGLRSKNPKTMTKSKLLKPFIEEIEKRTTPKDRKKYQYVCILKAYSEEEFEEWWQHLESQGIN